MARALRWSLALLLAVTGLLVSGCGADDDSGGRTGGSGLPVVALADLPAEVGQTVALVDSGGPFPYPQDGVTFHNREGVLPSEPDGYYQEYTVVTPGSPDRGARRIVAGEKGELYYTDDHYATFREVTQ